MNHLLPYLKNTYGIDGIYSNIKTCNFGPYKYKKRGNNEEIEEIETKGCVPNEIILWSDDITRIKC